MTVANNTADNAGGGAYFQATSVSIFDSEFGLFVFVYSGGLARGAGGEKAGKRNHVDVVVDCCCHSNTTGLPLLLF